MDWTDTSASFVHCHSCFKHLSALLYFALTSHFTLFKLLFLHKGNIHFGQKKKKIQVISIEIWENLSMLVYSLYLDGNSSGLCFTN